MTITIIGGQKNGVGKTTTAVNIATELAIREQNVLLVDCDVQTSSMVWNERRQTHKVRPAIATEHLIGKIHKRLVELVPGYDHIIIDVGARDTLEYRSALVVADKAILVNRPSVLDLDTYPFVLEIAKSMKAAFNQELEIYALLNQVRKSKLNRELAYANEIFEANPGAKVIENMLGSHIAFQRGMISGRSAADGATFRGNNAAAQIELALLVDEVYPELASFDRIPDDVKEKFGL